MSHLKTRDITFIISEDIVYSSNLCGTLNALIPLFVCITGFSVGTQFEYAFYFYWTNLV